MKSEGFVCVLAIAVFTTLALVVGPAAQGQVSGSAIADTGTTNPIPLINQPLVPDATPPGGSGFMLTVNGTGFVAGSVVNWNGSARTTAFISSSQLKATILASDIVTATTASVTVFNPAPGGGTSNVVFFPITVPNSVVSLSGSSISIPAGPWSVATADFNGDGKLDLAVPNEGLNQLYVLLGNGDGTFSSPVIYATGDGPQFLVTGDFNSDGKLDLAVGNVGDHTVSILLGNGDGTFQPHMDFPAGSGGDVVTVGDVNGDGKLDIVVTNYAGSTVSVLLGNGDGTFQPPVSYPTGANPNWTAIGDFNGDGKLDLATSNSSGNTVSILLGNGDGTFQSHMDYPAGQGPACVVAADFNGDGKLDLAIANNIIPGQVNILLGNGDGTFQSPVSYPAGNGAINLTAADLNGDGSLDLIVANAADNSVSILLGNGNGTFQQQTQYATGMQPRQVAVGDFNADGRLDAAVANIAGGSGASVLLQAATVSLSTRSLTFAAQIVGTNSLPKIVTLTNTGAVRLTISGITVTGADPNDFSQSNNCGSGLAPGGHCTISIRFKPTQIGPRTASLTITDSAPDSPQSVALSGTGVVSGPNATLSPTSLTFAVQLVGTTSPAQTVTLSNYGTMTLDITSINAAGDFHETNTCGTTLPTLASCTISVTFTPTLPGTRTGSLLVTDNAPGSPQSVGLTGVGTVVELNPSALNFGGITVGQRRTLTSVMTNVGNITLHILSITITGTYFSETNNCGGGLGSHQSCDINVTFAPGAPGQFSGMVSITDDGGASPQHVSLSGTGLPVCGGSCSIEHRCPSGCVCISSVCRRFSSLINDSLFEWNTEASFACKSNQPPLRLEEGSH
jgi:hypothetical protein